MTDAQKMDRLLKQIDSSVCLFRAFRKSPNCPEDLIKELEQRPKRKQISARELKKIVERKTARLYQRRALGLLRDPSVRVRAQSEKAFRANDPRGAIGPLLELKGVGVPMASAVLAWCFPRRWAVIDRHAWMALVTFGLLKEKRHANFTATDYDRFHGLVSEIARRTGYQPQKIDRWLFAYDKCQFDSDG